MGEIGREDHSFFPFQEDKGFGKGSDKSTVQAIVAEFSDSVVPFLCMRGRES